MFPSIHPSTPYSSTKACTYRPPCSDPSESASQRVSVVYHSNILLQVSLNVHYKKLKSLCVGSLHHHHHHTGTTHPATLTTATITSAATTITSGGVHRLHQECPYLGRGYRAMERRQYAQLAGSVGRYVRPAIDHSTSHKRRNKCQTKAQRSPAHPLMNCFSRTPPAAHGMHHGQVSSVSLTLSTPISTVLPGRRARCTRCQTDSVCPNRRTCRPLPNTSATRQEVGGLHS